MRLLVEMWKVVLALVCTIDYDAEDLVRVLPCTQTITVVIALFVLDVLEVCPELLVVLRALLLRSHYETWSSTVF